MAVVLAVLRSLHTCISRNGVQHINYIHSTQSWLRNKHKTSTSNNSKSHLYERKREGNFSKYATSNNESKKSKHNLWKHDCSKKSGENDYFGRLKNYQNEEVRGLEKSQGGIKNSTEVLRERPKNAERPRRKAINEKVTKVKSPANISTNGSERRQKGLKKAKSIKKNLILSSATQEEFLKNNRRKIESIIQYTFRDPQLLVEAFTHSSYPHGDAPSYERLEFLGDAILGYCITTHIYEQVSSRSPNTLTNVRSALVNGTIFGLYLVRMGLHRYIMSGNDPGIERPIAAFVAHQEGRNHSVSSGLQYSDGKAARVSAPGILGDVFESLAGAIYLDAGRNQHAVWRVYYAIMRKEIEQFCRDIPVSPERTLELCGAHHSFGPVEVSRTQNSEEHKASIKIRIHGREHTLHGYGNSKMDARWAAAKLALDKLDGVGVNLDGAANKESRSGVDKLDGASSKVRRRRRLR